MVEQSKCTQWPSPFGNLQDARDLWLRKAELRKGCFATSWMLCLLKFSHRSCFSRHSLRWQFFLGGRGSSQPPPSATPPAVCRDHGHWRVSQCAGYGSDQSGPVLYRLLIQVDIVEALGSSEVLCGYYRKLKDWGVEGVALWVLLGV